VLLYFEIPSAHLGLAILWPSVQATVTAQREQVRSKAMVFTSSWCSLVIPSQLVLLAEFVQVAPEFDPEVFEIVRGAA
jgi:hypothetical protein